MFITSLSKARQSATSASLSNGPCSRPEASSTTVQVGSQTGMPRYPPEPSACRRSQRAAPAEGASWNQDRQHGPVPRLCARSDVGHLRAARRPWFAAARSCMCNPGRERPARAHEVRQPQVSGNAVLARGAAPGVPLMLATLAAPVIGDSPLATVFATFLDFPIKVQLGTFTVAMPLPFGCTTA